MNRIASKLSLLMGTTSLLAIAPVAQAQMAPLSQTEALPEQVLITGSLIRGTAAVGVPVTSIGTSDFREVGAGTVGDVLIRDPAILGYATTATVSIGTPDDVEGHQDIAIHGIETRGSGTLMLIDGMRFPIQGTIGSLDPAIIPQLAIDRVDVLADGASATYGSDALAGVVNIILKKDFDGAITQFRVSDSPGFGQGALQISGSQLFGRKWDSGGITATYEFLKLNKVTGTGGSPYVTYNFTPWGLDNRTPLLSAVPAIVSMGAPAAPPGTPAGFSAGAGTTCSNCYSIPKGQNGVGLTWSEILANQGESNEFNPLTLQTLIPEQQRSSAVLTFDQRIVGGVQFYAEGFYSNLRSNFISNGFAAPIINAYLVNVPTTNPYYPAGAPAGLQANYNFNIDAPAGGTTGAVSSRYQGGFNLDLPYNWSGQIFDQVSSDHEFDTIHLINPNLVNAALGNVVPAVGNYSSFTKPANVPYLNVFCDPRAFTCNGPNTLAYINSHTVRTENQLLNEAAANFNGPLFDLPGGQVKGAIGTDYWSNHYNYYLAHGDTSALGDSAPNPVYDAKAYSVWAAYAQLNVPVVGEANGIPLVKALSLEFSGRIDNYNTVGTTKNPKAAFDWDTGYGLTLRGTWGTSFRAPTFQNLSTYAGGFIQPINIAAGNSVNATATCPKVGGTPTPGTVAAILDPNCTAALQFMAGLRVSGGSGIGALITPGVELKPETARNWALGFDFAPTYSFFRGLDISVTDWYLKINNVIQAPNSGTGLNDPLAYQDGAWIPRTAPGFAAAVARLLANPLASQSIVCVGGAANGCPGNIQFIANTTNVNVGWVAYNGLDWTATYVWDLGALGAWNVGAVGTYTLDQQLNPGTGFATRDLYKGFDTGGRLNFRARLGWAGGPDDAWTTTLFMNYRAHTGPNAPGGTTLTNPPGCFLAGNSPCNASGLPEFAQYTNQFQSFTLEEPALITLDLSIGYNTGDRPASNYLRNIGLQLTVNNLMDKNPRFEYWTSAVGGTPHAFDLADNPAGRTLILMVTKAW